MALLQSGDSYIASRGNCYATGFLAQSIMDFRMDSAEPKVQMPEIGRTVIHTEGVQLIRDWIDGMDPVDCSAI